MPQSPSPYLLLCLTIEMPKKLTVSMFRVTVMMFKDMVESRKEESAILDVAINIGNTIITRSYFIMRETADKDNNYISFIHFTKPEDRESPSKKMNALRVEKLR